MCSQFRSNNWKPQWCRFLACAALGGYLFTLFAAPVLHTHGCTHDVKTCCNEHSDSVPAQAPDSDDSCSVCEFARLVIPFFIVSEPLMWRADVVDEACVTVSFSRVACVAVLPPCRAPPVV